MAGGRFLVMVGGLVRRRSDGRYLLLRRSAAKDFGAGDWECVTGRLEPGESFTRALRRELREELGLEAEVDFPLATTRLYRGEPIPEHDMVGLHCACSVADGEGLRLSDEHSEHRWLDAEEALAFLPEEYWLRRLIARAEALRALMPPELLAHHRREGFEL